MTPGEARVPTNRFSELLAAVEAGEPLNARDGRFTSGDVKALLEAAPKPNGRPVLAAASFGGVSFDGPVSFEDVTFVGGGYFGNATFEGAVSFDRARFEGYAGFSAAAFEGTASFSDTTFAARADFQDTTWRAIAYFLQATFKQEAYFQGSTVFHGEARFDGAIFDGNLLVPKSFETDLWFAGTRFNALQHLGPLRVGGTVILDGATFERRVIVAVRADEISAQRTEFSAGADLHAQSAVIALDGAVFAAPSTLTSATRNTLYGSVLTDAAAYEQQTIPRVVSMQGARVADLALHGVDLRSCRFRGAQGLDRVQMEQVEFAETPSGWRRSPHLRLPMRWTRRWAIAEEHRWRAERKRETTPSSEGSPDRSASGDRDDDWWPAATRVRPATRNWQESDPPTPHQLAAVYRALRKAQEDRNDAPGAADFYYGEMEMRRSTRYSGGKHAGGKSSPAPSIELPLAVRAEQDSTRRTPAGERFVLYVYWLVSGYGMRASRALIALSVVVALSALLLTEFGIVRDTSYGRSLLFAIESSVSLLRAPDLKLTPTGELVTVALRLLGPLFFGLALLSLRGRVKR